MQVHKFCHSCLAQQVVNIAFVVLKHVLCQYCRASGVLQNVDVLFRPTPRPVLLHRYASVAHQFALHSLNGKHTRQLLAILAGILADEYTPSACVLPFAIAATCIVVDADKQTIPCAYCFADIIHTVNSRLQLHIPFFGRISSAS